MLKKTVLTLAAVGLLAGTASAANIDLNLYGASAQFKFWTTAAPTYLETKGCVFDATGNSDPKTIYQGQTGKHYIATCNNGTDVLTIRVSEAKSSEGINSVQGLLSVGSSNSCPTNFERTMATDVSSRTSSTKTGATTGCVDVTVGASDVAAGTFNQTTIGDPNWKASGLDPLAWSDPATYTNSATGITIPASYNDYRPVIVPFSFFVNADLNAEVPFNNLSRAQVLNLLAGKILNWNQFNADLNGNGIANEAGDYPGGDSLPVTLCMRHAGSGTLATVDANVVRSEATLVNTQAMPGDFVYYDGGDSPEAYFNTSSSDLMRCVGNNPGAFGYADSDKVSTLTAANNYVDRASSYGAVKKVAYNGYYSERQPIIDGAYGFWAAQWLYASNGEPTATLNLLSDLVNFAGTNAGLVAAGVDEWWVGQSEMNFAKASDFSMPEPK